VFQSLIYKNYASNPKANDIWLLPNIIIDIFVFIYLFLCIFLKISQNLTLANLLGCVVIKKKKRDKRQKINIYDMWRQIYLRNAAHYSVLL
jgi:hypothetical protein